MRALSGTASTPPSTIRTWRTRPSSQARTTAAEASAKSPALMANSANAAAAPAGAEGTTSAVSSSSGARAVVNGPRKNDSAGMVRSPRQRAQENGRIEGNRGKWELRGRIGVRKTPSDRPAHADRKVADGRGSVTQQGLRACECQMLDFRVAYESIDHEFPVCRS